MENSKLLKYVILAFSLIQILNSKFNVQSLKKLLFKNMGLMLAQGCSV